MPLVPFNDLPSLEHVHMNSNRFRKYMDHCTHHSNVQRYYLFTACCVNYSVLFHPCHIFIVSQFPLQHTILILFVVVILYFAICLYVIIWFVQRITNVKFIKMSSRHCANYNQFTRFHFTSILPDFHSHISSRCGHQGIYLYQYLNFNKIFIANILLFLNKSAMKFR